MSPQEASRLVGHGGHSSPQPETDIVERLRALPVGPADMMDMMREAADEIERLRSDVGHWSGAAVEKLANLASENDRLRTALRAVRASTCPRWQALLIAEALRETP